MDSKQGEVYSNRFFVRDRQDLLFQIRRRTSAPPVRAAGQPAQSPGGDSSDDDSNSQATLGQNAPHGSGSRHHHHHRRHVVQYPSLPTIVGGGPQILPTASVGMTIPQATALQLQQQQQQQPQAPQPQQPPQQPQPQQMMMKQDNPDLIMLSSRVTQLEANLAQMKFLVDVLYSTLQQQQQMLRAVPLTLPSIKPGAPATSVSSLAAMAAAESSARTSSDENAATCQTEDNRGLYTQPTDPHVSTSSVSASSSSNSPKSSGGSSPCSESVLAINLNKDSGTP